MNSSIFTWKETIAMGMICVAVVSLALSPNERLFPSLILTAIALTVISVAALIVSKRRRTSADGYKRQRIELRLTGLNKIEDGGLCLAIRTIENTRSLDELSTSGKHRPHRSHPARRQGNHRLRTHPHRPHRPRNHPRRPRNLDRLTLRARLRHGPIRPTHQTPTEQQAQTYPTVSATPRTTVRAPY